jgi:hypothetical protein
MMPENQTFFEHDSLQLITAMINKAKNRFSETGTLYLLWGWVIFICCISQFIVLYFFKNNGPYYIWYTTWLVLIYQVYYIIKKKRKQKVKTYADEIIGFVWLTFTICIIIIISILLRNDTLAAINPTELVLYGIPTFLSGIILKIKSLVIGEVTCWLLAIAAMFTTYEYQLLLLSVAVIFAWVIPGYLLRAKFKSEN